MTEAEEKSDHDWKCCNNSKWGHYCAEWDGLYICEHCDEFFCCGCFWDAPEDDQREIRAIQWRLRDKLET